MISEYDIDSQFKTITEVIISGNFELLSDLLSIANRAVVNHQNPDGWSLLHIAVDHGNVQICQKVLEHSNNKNCKNDEGLGAIHLAALNGSKDICVLLIQNGCDAKLPTDAEYRANGGQIIHAGSTARNIANLTSQIELSLLLSARSNVAEQQSSYAR